MGSFAFEVHGRKEVVDGHLPVVLTMGNFDGVHLGHQKLLRETCALREGGEYAVAMTFYPHPASLFLPERKPLLICPLEERVGRLLATGVDTVIVQAFTQEFAALSRDEFCSEILARQLRISKIHLGYDFSYGRNRSGDFEHMRSCGERYGWQVSQGAPLVIDGQIVSSSAVRAAVQNRHVDQAEHLLGRPFALSGVVVHGDARGRLLGFPTANLECRNELTPGTGVYACWVRLDNEGTTLYPAVMNCGYKPTVAQGLRFSIEAHILDFSRDIYGERVHFFPVSFLRHEQKFSGLEELKAQIARDCEDARKRLIRK